jgi:DNA-binding HxlR family transcriptional regulator
MIIMTGDYASDQACAKIKEVSNRPPPEIMAAFQVLSGKWTLIVLCHLSKGTYRFNELKRAIPGVTQHMLTGTLRELETNRLIQRTIFPEVPLRVEYELSAHGRSLRPVIEALFDWGRLHLDELDRLEKKTKGG